MISHAIHSINVVNVTKKFTQGGKSIEVLRGIDATFKQGSTYAITGVSGSGKSTLLQLLGGLDKPTSGEVFFDQQPLSRMHNKTSYLNTKLGFVFQFHYLIKELSVVENVMLAGLIRGDSRSEAQVRALELLELVGVAEKADMFPMKLSGGELQRVAIARALFNRPAFLVADEPTASLDSGNAELIIALFLRFQREWGMGLIICTHDDAVYTQMETVLHLHQGVLVVEKV